VPKYKLQLAGFFFFVLVFDFFLFDFLVGLQPLLFGLALQSGLVDLLLLALLFDLLVFVSVFALVVFFVAFFLSDLSFDFEVAAFDVEVEDLDLLPPFFTLPLGFSNPLLVDI